MAENSNKRPFSLVFDYGSDTDAEGSDERASKKQKVSDVEPAINKVNIREEFKILLNGGKGKRRGVFGDETSYNKIKAELEEENLEMGDMYYQRKGGNGKLLSGRRNWTRVLKFEFEDGTLYDATSYKCLRVVAAPKHVYSAVGFTYLCELCHEKVLSDLDTHLKSKRHLQFVHEEIFKMGFKMGHSGSHGEIAIKDTKVKDEVDIKEECLEKDIEEKVDIKQINKVEEIAIKDIKVKEEVDIKEEYIENDIKEEVDIKQKEIKINVEETSHEKCFRDRYKNNDSCVQNKSDASSELVEENDVYSYGCLKQGCTVVFRRWINARRHIMEHCHTGESRHLVNNYHPDIVCLGMRIYMKSYEILRRINFANLYNYWCEVCDMEFWSQNDQHLHFFSKKHAKKVKPQEARLSYKRRQVNQLIWMERVWKAKTKKCFKHSLPINTF